MKFLIPLFLFSVQFAFCETPKDDWIVITVKDGITIYTKESKSSPIKSLRAKGMVHAPLIKVLTILRDVDSAKDWIPNLIERSHVESISDTEAILYDVSDMPWPVTDRDMVIHNKLALAKDKKSLTLYLKSIETDKKPQNGDYVRAKFHFGRIHFTPKKDKTYIDMILLVDPMGSIPKWAVNVLQVSMPYDFLMSLNKFAGKSTLTPRKGILELVSKVEEEKTK